MGFPSGFLLTGFQFKRSCLKVFDYSLRIDLGLFKKDAEGKKKVARRIFVSDLILCSRDTKIGTNSSTTALTENFSNFFQLSQIDYSCINEASAQRHSCCS